MATKPPSELHHRMLPKLTDANRAFWTGGRDGRLLILRCRACDRWVHPPDALIHDGCGGALEPTAASGTGTVYTFTVNHQSFNRDVPLPYVIAIVELAEQADLRCFTNLVNVEADTVELGMEVRVLFEDHGEIFVPVFEPDC